MATCPHAKLGFVFWPDVGSAKGDGKLEVGPHNIGAGRCWWRWILGRLDRAIEDALLFPEQQGIQGILRHGLKRHWRAAHLMGVCPMAVCMGMCASLWKTARLLAAQGIPVVIHRDLRMAARTLAPSSGSGFYGRLGGQLPSGAQVRDSDGAGTIDGPG